MSLRFKDFPRRAKIAMAVAIGAAVVVAAAAPAGSQTLLQKLFPRITGGGQANTPPPADSGTLTVDPKVLATPGYCPELRLSAGGETFAFYDADRLGEPSSVRFQGSIVQTARECLATSETAMTMKVGIAGRIVTGPKGGPGKVTMPIRITAIKQHGNVVLFNKTYNINVTITSANLRPDFSQVIEPITFKRTVNDEDIIMYVGFDHPQ